MPSFNLLNVKRGFIFKLLHQIKLIQVHEEREPETNIVHVLLVNLNWSFKDQKLNIKLCRKLRWTRRILILTSTESRTKVSKCLLNLLEVYEG